MHSFHYLKIGAFISLSKLLTVFSYNDKNNRFLCKRRIWLERIFLFIIFDVFIYQNGILIFNNNKKPEKKRNTIWSRPIIQQRCGYIITLLKWVFRDFYFHRCLRLPNSVGKRLFLNNLQCLYLRLIIEIRAINSGASNMNVKHHDTLTRAHLSTLVDYYY